MSHNYFDVYYKKGENPTFCYRSGNMVYEEMLYNGTLLANGWNGAGYPLDLLACMPTRAEHKRYQEPFVFNIELDGQSVDYQLEFADFLTERTESSLKTTLVLKSGIKPVEIRVITIIDGTQMLTRYYEVKNWSSDYMCLSRLTLLGGSLDEMDSEKLTLSRDVDKFYSVGYFVDDRWANEGKFTWQDLKPEVTSIDTRFNRDRFRHPIDLRRSIRNT